VSQITLPLESTITLRKNGHHTVKHHTFVTGEVGHAKNAEKEAVNE
jgi:hypothetical protein